MENGESGRGENGVESENQQKIDEGKVTLITKGVSQRFFTKHKWLSIYFSARLDALSRVARVTILLSMILTNMAVASVFYNQQNESTTAQKIIVGVISSAISFVLSFGIAKMFISVRKELRWVSYTISGIYIAGTGFLTLWYNLKMEQSAAYGWCTSAAIGVVQDALVNEPLKILVIATLAVLFPWVPMLQNM